MRLAGKVAVVTGGARGIGRATVEKFLAEGARVAFLDIDIPAADATAAELSGSERPPRFIHCDVTQEQALAAAIQETVQTFGRLDVLVNNAGVDAYFDAATMTEAEWDRFFALDLIASWLCAKHAIPAMRQVGGGSIVNISSLHAFMTTQGMFPYAAAKSGLVGLTRSLAVDLGPENIRVNAICPGWTRTTLHQEWLDMQEDPMAADRAVIEVHPLRRIATPAEIANAIAFVASDEASFMTGAALVIDGGLSARYAS